MAINAFLGGFPLLQHQLVGMQWIAEGRHAIWAPRKEVPVPTDRHRGWVYGRRSNDFAGEPNGPRLVEGGFGAAARSLGRGSPARRSRFAQPWPSAMWAGGRAMPRPVDSVDRWHFERYSQPLASAVKFPDFNDFGQLGCGPSGWGHSVSGHRRLGGSWQA